MQSYTEFEKRLLEIKKKIDTASDNIDVQIKDYEKRQKDAKIEACRQTWIDKSANVVDFELIKDIKWFNASTTMKSVETDMESKLTEINQALSLIDLQEFPSAIHDDVVKRYKQTLNVMTAIEYGKNTQKLMAEQKAREEAKAQEEVKPVEVAPIVTPKASPFSEFEEAKVTRTYVITATQADLDALETMLTERGILWH